MKEYDINKPFWRSKKWWAAVVAALVPVLNQFFGIGLDSGEVTAIIVPAIVYILGQSYVDAKH